MDCGVLLRATPDAVYVCPPLVITRAEIDELDGRARRWLCGGGAERVGGRRGEEGGWGVNNPFPKTSFSFGGLASVSMS